MVFNVSFFGIVAPTQCHPARSYRRSELAIHFEPNANNESDDEFNDDTRSGGEYDDEDYDDELHQEIDEDADDNDEAMMQMLIIQKLTMKMLMITMVMMATKLELRYLTNGCCR